MTALNILLIEDDLQACEEIKSYIDSVEDVTLCGITDSAVEAIHIVQNSLPNAVIVDLELHTGGGNGLQFLAMLKQLHLNSVPYLLVTTNNSSHTTHEAARSLGADFIMTKYESGYNAQYVIDFLRMMQSVILKQPDVAGCIPPSTSLSQETSNVTSNEPYNTSSKQEILQFSPYGQSQEHKLLQYINEELNHVGISPKAVGRKYLIDAILLKLQDPDANIFSVLAPRYRKSDSSIERAMQNAINRAWRTCVPEDLLTYYTARIHSDRGVPTNMEFIYYYATKLRIDLEIS